MESADYTERFSPSHYLSLHGDKVIMAMSACNSYNAVAARGQRKIERVNGVIAETD